MNPYYSDGACQVHRGDATQVLPSLGVKADLILTSPPYDNLRDYGGHSFDFDRMADACVGALKEGGVLVWVVADATIDGSETGASFRQALGFMERGLKLHDTMIYHKLGPPLTMKKRYIPCWEYMFVFASGEPETANLIADKENIHVGKRNPKVGQGRHRDNIHGRNGHYVTAAIGRRTNIWTYKVGLHQSTKYRMAHEHPAIFPLALARDHILTWTNPGDLVVDPMAGSGTTLRAAKDLGRHSIGIEIHDGYLPIITGRLAQGVLIGGV